MSQKYVGYVITFFTYTVSHKFLFRTHVTGTIAAIHNDFGVVGVVRSGKMNILVAQVSDSYSFVTNIFGLFDLFSHYLSVTLF